MAKGGLCFDLRPGFEIAITSLMDRYMGGANPASAQRFGDFGNQTGQIYSMVILILFLFFPATLANVFRPTAPARCS